MTGSFHSFLKIQAGFMRMIIYFHLNTGSGYHGNQNGNGPEQIYVSVVIKGKFL